MAPSTGLQFPVVVYIVVLTHFIDEFGGCGHTQIEFLGQIHGNSGAPIIYIMCDDPFLRVHSCSRFPFLFNKFCFICMYFYIYLLYFLFYYINKYGFIILKYYVFDLLLCKLFCNYALIYINCRLYIN